MKIRSLWWVSLFTLSVLLLISKVHAADNTRHISDFNFNWQFMLKDENAVFINDDNEQSLGSWQTINIPHDWSVELDYTEQNAASSTGFKPAGVGWYRKEFNLSDDDLNKVVWLEFDGIYNNSQVWINGHFVTERPNGYISFVAPVSKYALKGKNVVTVKVNRTAYNDARWYTGSGIYRDVRLVKVHQHHIKHWGVQVTTPEVSRQKASIHISSALNIDTQRNSRLSLKVDILDANGEIVTSSKQKLKHSHSQTINTEIALKHPVLWQLDKPTLYKARVSLLQKSKTIDQVTQTFGIRSFEFTADRGFFLNGVQTKIKGVNLHHDAGAVGAAVPREVWRYRLDKLKKLGTNAIRLSHNPHSPDLLDLADEMGFLVIAEMFDDWLVAKDKSVVFLSDNAGKGESVKSYTEHFAQWAEQDLADLVRRDFNHPSVIMWSIGNEIEWTYPYYTQALIYKNGKVDYHGEPPVYTPERLKKKFEEVTKGKPDDLARTAQYLSKIVKSLDTSRPITSGLVTPSVGFVSGYTDALDVVGFNYRAQEYDIAHATYPDIPLYGSENWGTWPEWKAALDREFIPGIFIWTGFAYKGEAGPWPRKGLEISLFDYAGNTTPRGHQFETFWVDKPKVYLATIDAELSEYTFDQVNGWVFTEREHPVKQMQWVRKWEWYGVSENWNYKDAQPVITHVYSNTEESELFINGRSLGKQTISDGNNRILFWEVPFEAGELRVVGYNGGKPVAEYALHTHTPPTKLNIKATKTTLEADHYDVSHIHVQLLDKNGNNVVNDEYTVLFEITGAGKLLVVDNGWENSVQAEKSDRLTTHQGRALAIIQSTFDKGQIEVNVSVIDKNGQAIASIASNSIVLSAN